MNGQGTPQPNVLEAARAAAPQLGQQFATGMNQGMNWAANTMASAAAPVMPAAAAAVASAGLPVPPSHVALKFAQLAQNMSPHVLGTLLFRALQQHGFHAGKNANGVGSSWSIGDDNNNVNAYTEPGLGSVGFRAGGDPGFAGGTLGVANGQPFGSVNMNGKVIGQFGPQGPQPQNNFGQDFAQGFGQGLNILNPMVNGGNANVETSNGQDPRFYYASGKSRVATPQEQAAANQTPGNFGQDFAQGFAQGVNPATYINPVINGLSTPSNAQPQQGNFIGGSGTKVWIPNKQ